MSGVNQSLETLSPSARARLRWGGYVVDHPDTIELLAAGLIRTAPEHGPGIYVLTVAGSDGLSELHRRDAKDRSFSMGAML